MCSSNRLAAVHFRRVLPNELVFVVETPKRREAVFHKDGDACGVCALNDALNPFPLASLFSPNITAS